MVNNTFAINVKYWKFFNKRTYRVAHSEVIMSVIFKILTMGSSKPAHLIIIAFILLCPGVSNFGLGGDGHKLPVLIVSQFCYTPLIFGLLFC